MKLDGTSKWILICIPIISAVGCIVGAFFVQDVIAFIAGAAIGTLGSALRVFLLAKSATRAIDLKPKDAENQMRLSSLGGLFITAATLGLSLLLNNTGLYGAVVGILAMPAAAFITGKFIAKPESASAAGANPQGNHSEAAAAPSDES